MTETSDNEITPAQAFEAVRRELSLLHNAVANLTAARKKMPDHTKALEDINQTLSQVRARLAAVEKSPAVSLSPARMVTEINAAAQALRVEDRRMLDAARTAFERSLGWIDAIVRRGQAAEIQFERLILAAGGGLLAGIVLWSFLPGLVARSLPESWHVPEWMAARTLHMEPKAAGERLIATAQEQDQR